MGETILGSVCSSLVIKQLGIEDDDNIWTDGEIWEKKYDLSRKEDEEYSAKKEENDRKKKLADKVNRRLSLGIEIAKEQATKQYIAENIDSFVDLIISEVQEEESRQIAEEKMKDEQRWLEQKES